MEVKLNDYVNAALTVDKHQCPACGRKHHDQVALESNDGNSSIVWCPCGVVYVEHDGTKKLVYDFSKHDCPNCAELMTYVVEEDVHVCPSCKDKWVQQVIDGEPVWNNVTAGYYVDADDVDHDIEA